MEGYEEDYDESCRQVELLALYEGLLRLENQIKTQYWGYKELDKVKPHSFNLPMNVQEVKDLLKYMYDLITHLENFLKKTSGYQYYGKYVKRYKEAIQPYGMYYQYPYETYLKEKQSIQTLDFSESKLIKDAELLAEISGDEDLIEKTESKMV